jgi:hypothetical protein
MMKKKLFLATIFTLLIPYLTTAQDLSWSNSEGYESLGLTGTTSLLGTISVVNERVFILINKSGNFDKLLYSDDHGMTWEETGLTPSVFFPVIITSKQSDTLYAYGLTTSFALGIAKSTDLGESWDVTTIESGVSGAFEFFTHNSGKLLMAGRSPDLILSTDGGVTWEKTNTINETDEVESIRNVFSFGDYFYAQGKNSNESGAKGLYRMHKDDSTWTFLGDTTNVKDDNDYTRDNDVVFDEENQRIIMLWENPFQSGGDDDDIVIAFSDDFGDSWGYKTKADLGDSVDSGEYEELAIRGSQLMIVVKDGIQTGGNRVIAVDKNLTSEAYVNTSSDFEGLQEEKRMYLLKANSTVAFGYRELNEPFRRELFTYPAQTSSTISNEEKTTGVNTFSLAQNYPNPFNPATSISFSLPEASEVTLKVFNLLGQEITTLVNGRINAGNHAVNFDASALSSGVYIYRLQAGSSLQTKKMTLIK